MVSLKHYDRKAKMPMRFVVKNVHRKTRKHSLKYTLYVIKFFPFSIYFDTNFEMINVVSLKMVKNMLLRSSQRMYIPKQVNLCPSKYLLDDSTRYQAISREETRFRDSSQTDLKTVPPHF